MYPYYGQHLAIAARAFANFLHLDHGLFPCLLCLVHLSEAIIVYILKFLN